MGHRLEFTSFDRHVFKLLKIVLTSAISNATLCGISSGSSLICKSMHLGVSRIQRVNIHVGNVSQKPKMECLNQLSTCIYYVLICIKKAAFDFCSCLGSI